MELIKLSENKTKLVLNQDELELYGVCRNNQKNIKAVEKIFTYLKHSSGLDLISSSMSVKIKFCCTGECEITLEKVRDEFEIKTFVFTKKELDFLLEALKNTYYQKNSALYKYKDVYIFEILAQKNSPLTCRISDFGREVVLCSRRDFLSSVCERINLP